MPEMKIPRIAVIGIVAFAVGADAKKDTMIRGPGKPQMENEPFDIIRREVAVEPRREISGADRENQMAQHKTRKEHSSIRKRPARRRTGSNNALLVKGFGTNMCWKVQDGDMSAGNAIVLDECNGNDAAQQFEKSSYHYDYETGASSWIFRPLRAHHDSDLYVAGDQESKGSPWRMVLKELRYGITQPLTQVFWTMEGKNSEGADIMGMGDHAYSTRLFVTNDGKAKRRNMPVVLKTKDRIYEAEKEIGEGNIVPGLWSYVYVA